MESKLTQIASGMRGGRHYSESGRSANPVCVPHDPDLGPVISTNDVGTLYGMEYNEPSLGKTLKYQDVPCAVCRSKLVSSVIMMPGKTRCYHGLGGGGYYNNGGRSATPVCVPHDPDIGPVSYTNGYSTISILETHDEKRILPTDPDYADNLQFHRDIQTLKSAMENIKQTVLSQSTLIQKQTVEIANVKTKLQQKTTEIASLQIKTAEIADLKTKFQQQTAEIANLQTNLQQREKAQLDLETTLQQMMSSIGSGGFMDNKGRSATPVCVPHDPDLGPVSSTGGYSTMYGMEYNDAAFGNNLFDKDVPCAVCRAIHSTSVIMIPGKASCHKGWNMEYKGLLASGNRFDNGASTYICIDQIPDVLEGGVQDDNGYILFPVKAICGSLKCPPYVQNMHRGIDIFIFEPECMILLPYFQIITVPAIGRR
ncbi:uncharacterized protein [Mytilus edulis]|uniref:uncharacterized protein n=1 Tax=Mytilus edulis TaxID=6550 RepID=UPI0039F13EBC